MDQNRFQRVTKALTAIPSRRNVLRGLTSMGLGLGVAQLPVVVDAKKKRKGKKKAKKPRPNAFGCLNVGDPCTNAGQCCSGICAGKKGKKRCRAHGTGTCDQGAPGFCRAENPAQALCNDSMSCVCLATTGGSAFCGSLAARASGCADCKTDADCLVLGLPSGSACVPFSTGSCAGSCPNGMACVAPCDAVT